MKSLSQNIPDPVVIGAGDANGRTLRIIFTQEAAAQFTEDTKVYLSWYHQEQDIKGYNVFTRIVDEEDEDFPPTWEIHYPKSMLHEGNVLACIQLVDDKSIATSTNFMIHVLIDPNSGQSYIESDDYSDFQKAVIVITNLSGQMTRQMEAQKLEFEDMQLEFMDVRQVAHDASDTAAQAKEIADASLSTAQEALQTILGFENLAEQAINLAQSHEERITQLEEDVHDIDGKADRIADNIQQVADNIMGIIEELKKGICHCGLTPEEAQAMIDEAFSRAQDNLDSSLEITEWTGGDDNNG